MKSRGTFFVKCWILISILMLIFWYLNYRAVSSTLSDIQKHSKVKPISNLQVCEDAPEPTTVVTVTPTTTLEGVSFKEVNDTPESVLPSLREKTTIQKDLPLPINEIPLQQNVHKEKRKIKRSNKPPTDHDSPNEDETNEKESTSTIEKINNVSYMPLQYSEPPISKVKYTKSGMIDAKKNHIDFMKSNWYAQFQYFRELLSNQPSMNSTFLQQWWEDSNRESEGQFTVNYGILTNACLNPPENSILLYGEKGKKTQKEGYKTLRTRDFYFSSSKVMNEHLSYDQLHQVGNHTAVIHPRNFKNIYHFLEGSSQLVRLALQPYLFPPISHIVVSGQPSSTYQKWHGFLEYIYLDLFSESKRPTIHFIRNDKLLEPHSLFCDKFMVVLRNWDSSGAGDFIPLPLGVDLIRAAAYKRVGLQPSMKCSTCHLSLTQVSRVNKRRILNEQELYSELVEKFKETIDSQFIVLESESAADQVKRFMNVDILVAAHGAGLTNMIYMLPHSYLIELMPPYWDLACYKRLAINANVGYTMLRAKGKKGPQCKKDPSSQACRRQGIRDRDFVIKIRDVVKAVAFGESYVRKEKYNTK